MPGLAQMCKVQALTPQPTRILNEFQQGLPGVEAHARLTLVTRVNFPAKGWGRHRVRHGSGDRLTAGGEVRREV